jgi:excisionase family DNA binding protein
MYDDGYLTPEECATRMGISVDRVLELARRGVLRTTRVGLWVQPAIVSGAVDE